MLVLQVGGGGIVRDPAVHKEVNRLMNDWKYIVLNVIINK